MTTRAPRQRPADNAAILAGLLAFVMAAGVIPAVARPVLNQLFLGYTPHYLGTLLGVAAGYVAARLAYRRVRAAS